MTKAAGSAAKTVQQQTRLAEGMAGFGTKAHVAFAKQVKALGLGSEVSYKDGLADVTYGMKGSVRLDAVLGDPKSPQAVYDLKTGTAGLTSARIQQIRDNLPPAYRNIPIIELRIDGTVIIH